MEQTTLQKIIDQKADQIRIAIEEAIDAGAKIENKSRLYVTIDNIFLQRDYYDSVAFVLHFESKKILKLFESPKDDLEKLAEQKRAELEEIEKQIKERDEE